MHKNYFRVGISQNAGGGSIGSHRRVRVLSRLTSRSEGAVTNVFSADRQKKFVKIDRNGLFCDRQLHKEREGVTRGGRGERAYAESGRVDNGHQYKDPWDLLGVDPAASEEDIKKAHRKLVLKLHPDRHGGDKKIERKFIAVQEAYEMLLGRRMPPTAADNGTGVSQGGWKFHDWFWSFPYLRRKKKMEKGNSGEAKMPPPPAGHWRQQMLDLKKRAVARKMRKNQKSGFVVDDQRMEKETDEFDEHVRSAGSEKVVEHHDDAVKNEKVKGEKKWNAKSLFETYKEGHMQHTQAMEDMSARISHVSSHISTFRERLSSVGNRTRSAMHGNGFDDEGCLEHDALRSENCSSSIGNKIDLSSPGSGMGEEETNRNERNDEQQQQDNRPGHVAKQLAGLKRKAALKQEILD